MTNYTEVARANIVWRGMLNRCENPKNSRYHRYGGRGIYVVPEWQDFNVFCQWMLDKGSTPGLDVDRIDNDGPYSPDNCRLVTRTVNCRNKGNNHILTAWGESKCISEWEEDPRCVLSRTVIENRINMLGWDSTEKVLTTPKDRVRKSQNPTHCKAGNHEYTIENTYYSKATPHIKKCRKCHSDRQSARYYQNKFNDTNTK